MNPSGGIVYLVGGGPGDPGLLTLKGQQCLRRAEVVVYDSLVNPAILRETRPEAELIYVGKRSSRHLMQQEAINALLVERGRAGQTVVRLKGGDPFLFARGGEEAEALADAGVAFEIVPGVPSPTAVLAYAGIPVTHRFYTSSLAIVTGTESHDKPQWAVDWSKLATSTGTIVFLMCWAKLKEICSQLVSHGRDPQTPAAVIQWGTRPEQRTIEGPLCDIARRVEEAKLVPPSVLVVGEVVRLRSKLNWYETKPLFGQRIVVTRPRAQAEELVHHLEFFGAETLLLPTIRIAPAPDPKAMEMAMTEIASFDWVVFTSVNAVDAAFETLSKLGKDARVFHGVQICSIGPATAQRLESFGLRADRMPPAFKAESIVESFEKEGGPRGQRFLLPRADIAPPLLPDGLRRLGAEVHEVAAYQTLPEDAPPKHVLERLLAGEIAFVTFTSSSTVDSFIRMVTSEIVSKLPPTLRFVSIGSSTSATIRKLGLQVAVEAQEHTVPGMVKSLVEFVQKEKARG